MNNIFKVIWSKTKNSYVVVSEIAKRNGKCSSSLNKKLIAAFLAAGTVITINSVARAEIPEGSAMGLNAVAIGVDSTAAGIASTVVGTGSTIGTNTKYMFQGATSNIFGAYNSIRVYDNKNYPYDGVASSIIGVANDTYMSNGALIFGSGNSIQKSYGNVNSDADFVAAAQAYASESSEENYKALQTALSNAVAKSGGNVMAIGGANKAEFAKYSELIGVGNELHGTSSTKLSTDTYLNGHNNIATYTSNVTVIGSQNHIGSTKGITANTVILGDNNNISTYDKGLAVDNIVIGNNHTLDGTGTTDSTKAKNNIILGSWDEKTDEDGNQITHARKLQETIMIGHNADVQGNYGVAVGYGAVTKLQSGIAIGKGATAVKNSSIAIGDGATAEGQSAIAIGSGATAKGMMAVAFGRDAVAEGGDSFAHGGGIAKGGGSTAWGNSAQAIANTSTAWGNSSKASGNGSTAWGGIHQTRDGNGNIVKTETTASGKNSTAFGQGTHASGVGATTWGDVTEATNQFATAFGSMTEATGYYATSFGSDTVASGYSSTAFGADSIAAGRNATAFGSGSKAFGSNSLAALGGVTGAGSSTDNDETGLTDVTVSENAQGAVAVGNGALALKSYTYAVGQNAQATKTGSIAIGNDSTASGDGAVAFGNGSTVSGKNSIALGKGHTISGANSGAFGDPTTINADNSYSVGNDNTIGEDFENVFALGNNITVVTSNSVFLGDSAAYVEKGESTGGLDTVTEATVNGITYGGFAGPAPVGVVSVGDAGSERRLQNVAAGLISATSTDAINGSQLYQALANQASNFEIKAGDNITIKTETIDGVMTYTVSSSNATAVKPGDNVAVDGPATAADSGGSTTDDGTTGSEATTTDEGTYKTDNYTVNAADSKVTGVAVTKGTSTTTGNTTTTEYTVTLTSNEQSVVDGEIVTKKVEKTDTFKVADNDTKYSFNGDSGDTIDASQIINIKGGATGELSGGNIGVVSDGKDTLTVKLANDIKDVDSIEVNKTITVGGNTTIDSDGLTINNGPSITKNGVDAGGKKITNVANGTADTDAVNVSQLKSASGDIYNTINNMDNRMQKGLAGAAALAALHPMDFNPDDKLQFSAGVGNYRGETAAAVGMFYRPDESVMFSLGGTFGNSDNMVNAGITFGLDGTRNRITRSRTAMAREIQDLRSLVTQMAARMDRLEGANSETAMFPDVPENHWAYEYVEDLQKRGALKGYPDGLFKGDRAMTRYEFAAMLDRLVRSGVMLDSKIAKEFEPELGRIYVERISGQDNDRKKVERVRVNNSDSKYPEGKTRDVYGSKIVTEIPKKPEAK